MVVMSPYALASATYRHLSSELPKKKEKKKEKYDTKKKTIAKNKA